jgi:Mg2+ and Co2+ transporter CorA
MKKFTREIIKEALDNLAKNVKESMYEQTEDVEEYLRSICEERDKALETIQEQIKKMVDNDEVDEIDKSCIEPLYVVAVSDKVSEIFQ